MSTRRQIGLFAAVRNTLLGAPNEAEIALKEASSHGAAQLKIARAFSSPLLIAFSIVAIMVMGRSASEHNIAAFEHGMATGGIGAALAGLNYYEVTMLVVVAIFVIAADLAALAAMSIAVDRIANGHSFKSVLGYVTIAVAVGSIEATTFAIMLVSLDHPQTAFEWAYIMARSVLPPAVAFFLATLRKRGLTERDSTQLIEMRLNERIISLIDSLDISAASLGQLMSVRLIISDPHASREEIGRALIDALESLSPDAVGQAIAAKQRELDELIERTRDSAFELVTRAIFSLSSTGTLPDWVIERAPELATLKIGRVSGAGAKRGRSAVQSEPKERQGKIRWWLEGMGIVVDKTPAGKRGTWLIGSEIALLIDGGLSDDAKAKLGAKLAKDLGDETKRGTAWAASFDRVMEQLYQHKQLTSDALAFYEGVRIAAA